MNSSSEQNPSEKLEESFNQFLKEKGVKLPKKGKLRCALECLVERIGTAIHIDDIRNYVEKCGYKLTGTDGLQVRHLSTQNGFHIVKEGIYKHKLVNLTESHPSYIKEKRNITIDKEGWESLLSEYDYMCVNCGSKEGGPLRWKKTETTKLQKGHMDPRKDLSLANCIPQCQFCNQRYKDKAVFDKRGQTILLL